MSTVSDTPTAISQLSTVIEKAASDPTYRKALELSTKATLASAGITIPDGLTVKLVENSDKIRSMITYAKSSLSSEDLQQVKSMVANAGPPKTAIESYAKLIIDSWGDPALEKQIATNAKSALAKYGISLPSGVTVKQLVASSSVAYLPLTSDSAIASNITSSFGGITKLITGGSYLVGLGYAVASTLKFKQHKDNPTQIPVGTPIALVLVSAAQLFYPTLVTATSS